MHCVYIHKYDTICGKKKLVCFNSWGDEEEMESCKPIEVGDILKNLQRLKAPTSHLKE